MRQFDLSPLYRTTVGFDRVLTLLDSMAGANGEQSTFPPYNIERTGENAYRITMAVAGFSAEEMKLEVKESLLTVRGEKAEDEKERQFLHRGIAARNFERRFQLADYVEVVGADLKDGMLHVDLKRELPERMKPRSIAIGSSEARHKLIEQSAA
ncbi:MAG: Hsp20 family protein [Hyphomicrobiaceae bacterium]